MSINSSVVKRLLMIGVLLSGIGMVQAQDAVFSQYNTSPLNLNPALTGFFNADYRLTGNFRSQWGSFTSAYRTTAFSGELSPFKAYLREDNFGIGLSFSNDKAGSAGFSTNNLALSLAYRKSFGQRVKHGLAIGAQASYINQSVDGEKLIFDSQYNGVVVDPDAPSGEAISGGSGTIDAGVGLLWHIIPDEKYLNFYIGGAYYHLLRPQLSLGSATSIIEPRYVGHFGAKVVMSEYINLLPSVAYMQQVSAYQINGGTYLQFVLEDNLEELTAFAIGAWARVAEPAVDAVIVGARLDFRNFVASMSYDFNISRLANVSKGRGAYEISLIYTGYIPTPGKRRLSIPCPQL